MNKEYYVEKCLKLAEAAVKRGDVPVGAVIVKNGKIISKGYNQKEKHNDSTMHAEIIAIKKACKKLKTNNLTGCDIYISFEPCLMCVGAILNARINSVYFGAFDNRFGACELLKKNNFNHTCFVEGGVLKEKCSLMLTSFFKNVRRVKNANTNKVYKN